MFAAPTPFAEAIASRDVKTALPTSASSSQLAKLAPELRERSLFSARVTNVNFLDRFDALVRRIVSPETVAGRPAQPGEYMDRPTARLDLKRYLDSIGYYPDPAKRGGLQDLSSDARLNLILDTNSQMAQGYGQFIQGQDETLLDLWPAQELYRLEARKTPRDWPSRWQGAGGRFYGGGRMIALKNDQVWTEISDFGLPYPPFAFGSGMWTRDVDRDEAVALGLIAQDDPGPAPATRGFNDDLSVSIAGLNPDLRSALLSAFSGSAQLEGDALRLS